jgi:hypothetical protein
MSTYRSSHLVADSTGNYALYPEHCSHAYTYNADGTVATDTATGPITGMAFLKTYTYTAGNLTGETAWVKQ